MFSRLKSPSLAAALTCMVLITVFAAFGLYPFGERSLSWGDMSQQVVPLMMELKDILEGQSGMFLNLQNAGGMSFWGVFCFFLSSPFSFLALLVEKPDIFRLVNVLVMLKLALSAGTASWYFQRESPSLTSGTNLALAISYGLCGYGMLYYQNLVWLDMLCLFPVVMAGFSRLMADGRTKLLTIGLMLAVVVNYYLSFMLFLTMLICGAVFIFLCASKDRRGELAGKLGGSAFKALLVSAAVWLPSVLQCLASARTDGVLEGIRRGGFWTQATTTLPVLLCSAGALAPLMYRLFPGSRRSKALGICWTMTSLPMLIEPVNKLWHFGSYQAFPARYGYIPVFLGLCFLADRLETAENEGDAPKQWRRLPLVVLALPLAVGGGLLIWRFEEISSYTSTLWVRTDAFRLWAVFWAVCAVTLFAGCLVYKHGAKRTVGWMLMILSLIQGGVQAAAFIGSAANIPETSLKVLETAQPEDAGLYRVKSERKFCHVNLLGAAGYPTTAHYTSLTDRRFLGAMKKLGYSSYWMENSGCCGTVVGDMLMSNKYALQEDFTWMPTGSGNLGYLTPSGVLPAEMELGERLELQNTIAESLAGVEPFELQPPVQGQASVSDDRTVLEPGLFRWEVQVKERASLYFDAFDCISNSLKEKINDGFTLRVNGRETEASYPTQRCNGILELGTFQDETVIVEAKVHKHMSLCSFGLWSMELSKAEAVGNSLTNVQLSYRNGKIIGSASANAEQALFLSVPWYSGMDVRVNSQQVQPRIVLDCFMEIPLSAGENQIEISYFPLGLGQGIAISVATLVVLAISPLLRHEFLEPVRRIWHFAAWRLLEAAFCAVVLAVYLIPVALWAIK